MDLLCSLEESKKASLSLQDLDTLKKNQALDAIRKGLVENKERIKLANKKDLELAVEISPVMRKRLELTDRVFSSLLESIALVIDMNDPVGEIIESYKTKDDLLISKVRVPFGVILGIYESRPNVTVDMAVLAIKTGNAIILKGGKESLNTNREIAFVMRKSLKGITDENVINFVVGNHDDVLNLIKETNYIDLVIPRGSKNLINFVVTNSLVPVIETGAGVCHAYVSESADFNEAIDVICNAKVSKPEVCNSLESVLVDESIAQKFIPLLAEEMKTYGVTIFGDKKVQSLVDCEKLFENQYGREYNDLKMSVIIVNGIDEAITHINKYGTHHSDSIMAKDEKAINRFMKLVDSACVYANSSTRFTDGGCFGFGAEIGISTQKLHARGPMGLKEITTYKYCIYGKGSVRK